MPGDARAMSGPAAIAGRSVCFFVPRHHLISCCHFAASAAGSLVEEWASVGQVGAENSRQQARSWPFPEHVVVGGALDVARFLRPLPRRGASVTGRFISTPQESATKWGGPSVTEGSLIRASSLRLGHGVGSLQTQLPSLGTGDGAGGVNRSGALP